MRVRFDGHLSVGACGLLRARAAGQYDLQEPDDLIKLLLTMTRNKVAEKMRRQHRLRRDSRRTLGGVEELALAARNPTPSSVVAGKELLEKARQRLRRKSASWLSFAGRPQLGGSRRHRGGNGRGAAEPVPVRSTESSRNCDSTSHDWGVPRS